MTTSKLYPQITTELIEKYDLRVPRYTSYPTVPHWSTAVYGPEQQIDQLKIIGEEHEPISLYIHIPFCERRCLFCGCNVLVTKKRERSERYLEYLYKEINKTADLLQTRNDAIQLHIGGGTPTHLTPEQLDTMLMKVEDRFKILPNAEMSVEIHPSITSTKHIDVLSDHKFNRISMGVQDFDPVVQENLNRFQTYEETVDLINYCRASNFASINVDLIYGLPYQTPKGFENTIEQIKSIGPDRIALYSYAHFPTVFPHHKHIPLEMITTGVAKLELFLKAREKLLEFKYQQIGFDHFALPEDELYQSFLNKSLRRNFMGYTTKAGTDMIAFGYSSISEFTTSYSQNTKEMKEYETLIDKYGIATVKGHIMSDRDKVFKQIIMDILCLGTIDYSSIQKQFPDYYEEIVHTASNSLKEFGNNGFIRETNSGWELSPEGNIFARVVAAKFDDYLKESSHLFSKSV